MQPEVVGVQLVQQILEELVAVVELDLCLDQVVMAEMIQDREEVLLETVDQVEVMRLMVVVPVL